MGESELQDHRLRQRIAAEHGDTRSIMRLTDGAETVLQQEDSNQNTVHVDTSDRSLCCMRREGIGHEQQDESCTDLRMGRFDVMQDTVQEIQRLESLDDPFESLPDHLIIEVLVRLPASFWASAACVRKRWAALFRGDVLWQNALAKRWPRAGRDKRWPGPIGRGSSKRRYTALHVSKHLFNFGDPEGDVDELAGHVYLFLKEQLEVSSTPLSYGLLHGTIIDQFLACGKAGSMAHELASQIWLAVIDNLEESEHTFHLLMRIAEEWEVFLPYPYSKSHAVQWRLFERLFTDFRDCLTRFDYYNVLTRAKHKFEFIPPTWLGY